MPDGMPKLVRYACATRAAVDADVVAEVAVGKLPGVAVGLPGLPEAPVFDVVPEVDIGEMVSVAEEQSATVAFMNKVGVSSPARDTVRPEHYRVQPPCVRLCAKNYY